MDAADEIRARLERIEPDLGKRVDTAMMEIGACVEWIVRRIVYECFAMAKAPDDLRRLTEVEAEIGRGQRNHVGFGLGELHRLWRQVRIPDLWKKIYGFTPASFQTFPFEQLCDFRNPSMHHGRTPSPATVRKYYYATVELLEDAFPLDRVTPTPAPDARGARSNLPRVDHEFVGRPAEIAMILDWLSSDNRAVLISITGVGGVGKTSLAIEVANRCCAAQDAGTADPEMRFDAYVWTSAKRKSLFGDGVNERVTIASNLEAIVTEIIRVVSPEHAKNLPSQSKQLELARQLLTEHRVLLIVDNMETIEDQQVRGFLEDLPGRSKAIITDRRSVPSSRPIRLTELSDDEAERLIDDQCKLRRLTLTREQVQTLTRRTGGIPLAIVWAIGQMAATWQSPEAVFRRLADARDANVLDFLFGESFGRISANARRIIAALSLPDSPVEGHMLAHWTELGDLDAEDALAELVGVALVSVEDADGRQPAAAVASLQRSFRLLPLTREYVRGACDASDLADRERISREIFALVSEREPDPSWPSTATIDLIDQRRALLIWALEDAFARSEHRLVLRLAHACCYSLGIRGYHDLRLRLGQRAVEAARALADGVELARNLITNVAWVNFIWYRFDECEQSAREGLAVAKAAGSREMEGCAIRLLGLVAKERQRLDEAASLLDEAVQIFSSNGDAHLLAISYGSIASLRRDIEDFSGAEAFLERALEVSRGLRGTEEIRSIFFQKLAKLYVYLGRLDEAELANRQAQSILQTLRRPAGVAHCKLNLALIAEQRGEIADALAYANEASTLFYAYGSKEDITRDLERIRGRAATLGLPL